mmetsp:Transcript_22780/g.77032  ORF Transcript_22780/g.77032 Transcript_22780/m.77032 type:complete len:368 (-) Transcript_22780:283-1386(-)
MVRRVCASGSSTLPRSSQKSANVHSRPRTTSTKEATIWTTRWGTPRDLARSVAPKARASVAAAFLARKALCWIVDVRLKTASARSAQAGASSGPRSWITTSLRARPESAARTAPSASRIGRRPRTMRTFSGRLFATCATTCHPNSVNLCASSTTIKVGASTAHRASATKLATGATSTPVSTYASIPSTWPSKASGGDVCCSKFRKARLRRTAGADRASAPTSFSQRASRTPTNADMADATTSTTRGASPGAASACVSPARRRACLSTCDLPEPRGPTMSVAPGVATAAPHSEPSSRTPSADRCASSATTAATARVSAARPTVTVKSNCSEKSPARMLPKLALKPGLCTGRCAASSLKAASQTKTGSG